MQVKHWFWLPLYTAGPIIGAIHLLLAAGCCTLAFKYFSNTDDTDAFATSLYDNEVFISKFRTYAKEFMIIFCLKTLCYVIGAALVILGTRNRSSQYLIGFLVVHAICLGLLAVFYMTVTFLVPEWKRKMNLGFSIPLLHFYIMLVVYNWIAIRSLLDQVKDDQRNVVQSHALDPLNKA